MSKLLFTLAFILCGLNYAFAQDIACNDRNAISMQLSSVREKDQQIRARVIKEMASHDPEKIKQIALEMRASDKANQTIITALLDKCGWPKGLSELDNNTIFLVIDHADTTYMNKYFPLLKAQADSGVVSKSDLATLEDRMQLKRGQKQLYGTQTFKIGSTVTIWPIAEPEKLDIRRKKMGLLVMEDYISLLKKTYQSEVIWEKDMSVEKAQEKMRKKQ